MKIKNSKSTLMRQDYQQVLRSGLSMLTMLVLACVLYSCFQRGKALDLGGQPAIAVIPVSNTLCDPELEYISAGLHEAIISELGNINSLLVKSKTASQKYTNSELTGQQIGHELGANVIIKTSMICTDEGMRLKVQLMQVSPEEKEIWSGTYDQDMEQSITMIRDITRHIARSLKATITQQEKAHLNTSRQVNPELYKKYLQGVFYMNKLTPEGIESGFNYLKQAIALDPSDPLPHLAIALGYSNAGHASGAGEDAPKLAREHALKALELDSTLAEAHTVLAADYLYRQWDFKAAERSFKRAIDLNPSIASLQYNLGWYHCLTQQWDKAEEAMKQAVAIDPLDPICIGYLAWLYQWTGRHKDAIAAAQKTLELDPNYIMAYYVLGSVYADMGKYDLAIETHKKGIAISPAFQCGLGVAYALAGKRKEALGVAAELEKYNNYWFTWGLADIYVTLGDTDKAIYWIESAYKQRHDFVPWLQSNLYYKPLIHDPRFQEIISRLNLPA